MLWSMSQELENAVAAAKTADEAYVEAVAEHDRLVSQGVEIAAAVVLAEEEAKKKLVARNEALDLVVRVAGEGKILVPAH